MKKTPCYAHIGNGQVKDLWELRPADVDFKHVSRALQGLNRFAGLSPVSVGRHSLFVYRICALDGATDKVRLAALLHDAAEAYLGDIPSPVKALAPEICKLEEQLLSVIYSAACVGRLSYKEAAMVKKADKIALFFEVAFVAKQSEWLTTSWSKAADKKISDFEKYRRAVDFQNPYASSLGSILSKYLPGKAQ